MSSPQDEELTTPNKTSPDNPRTKRMRDAVLKAVAELILEEGAGAVTALRVSQRAEVSRSTIYDHWPTPEALVLDAVDMVSAPHAPVATTAHLETDLLTALTGLRDRLELRPFRIWFATLLDHGNRDAAFAAAQTRFVTSILRPVSDAIEAAKRRGEIAEEINCVDTAAQLAAPVLTQHVLLRTVCSDKQIAETVAQFLGHQTRTD